MKNTGRTRNNPRDIKTSRRGLLKTLTAAAGLAVTAAAGFGKPQKPAPSGGVEARYYSRGDHLAG